LNHSAALSGDNLRDMLDRLIRQSSASRRPVEGFLLLAGFISREDGEINRKSEFGATIQERVNCGKKK
jgi:hypothetical protein